MSIKLPVLVLLLSCVGAQGIQLSEKPPRSLPGETLRVTSGGDVAAKETVGISESKFSPMSSEAIERDLMAQPNVLLLGSGGFLGKALMFQLSHLLPNVNILEVRNRTDLDLRNATSLDFRFGNITIDFIFFLACEVGGSKFLESPDTNVQLAILHHNQQIYETVFNFAVRRGTPLLFTSSYLRFMDHGPYAAIKRLGEEWVAHIPHAKQVRLWNLYGPERLSLKSHVMADWVSSCVKNGFIASTTDALERRQFLHVQDAASALVAIYRNFNTLDQDKSFDISSNEWVSLRHVAEEISRIAVSQGLPACVLHPAPRAAPYRPEIAPDVTSSLHMHWQTWVHFYSEPGGVAREGCVTDGVFGCLTFQQGLEGMIRDLLS